MQFTERDLQELVDNFAGLTAEEQYKVLAMMTPDMVPLIQRIIPNLPIVHLLEQLQRNQPPTS